MKKIFNPLLMMQRTVCGLLSGGVTTNCNYLGINGDEISVYIANKDDIASYSFNGTNPLVIEGITMKSTKVFYKFDGKPNSNSSKDEMIEQKYSNKYKHTWDGIIWNVNGATKKQLEAMGQGLFVMIIEHKFKGPDGESAFEIYGREQGLKMRKCVRDQSVKDNDGMYAVTLSNHDDFLEGHLPAPFFLTNYDTTAALIADLI